MSLFHVINVVRFIVAYTLYASVVLGYTYYLLTHPAGALFGPPPVALVAVTAASLALPILDAAGWRLLRPGRIGKALATVLLIGVTAEAAVKGDLDIAYLLSMAIRLITYLIVLAVAVMLYQMARPREMASGRNGDVTRHYTS